MDTIIKAEKTNKAKKILAIGVLGLLVVTVLWFYLFPQSRVPRAAGQVLQQAADATTSGKVKSAFMLSKRLSPYDIEAVTQNGMVTLSGPVPSEIDKELAEKVARDTRGVNQVSNQLVIEPQIKPSEASLRESERIVDLEVQADLRERLAASADLSDKTIQISVANRNVTLAGEVETPAQKSGAEQLARSLANVTGVTNQLSVSNPAIHFLKHCSR